jgi:hypothetical protein
VSFEIVLQDVQGLDLLHLLVGDVSQIMRH